MIKTIKYFKKTKYKGVVPITMRIEYKVTEEQVLKAIGEGLNLVQAGRKLGVSRERIRQIYNRTGRNYTDFFLNRSETSKRNKLEAKAEYNAEVIKTCVNCGAPIIRGKNRGSKQCLVCLRKRNLSQNKIECSCCGKEFYPTRTSEALYRNGGTKRIFCSRDCYTKSRRVL